VQVANLAHSYRVLILVRSFSRFALRNFPSVCLRPIPIGVTNDNIVFVEQMESASMWKHSTSARHTRRPHRTRNITQEFRESLMDKNVDYRGLPPCASRALPTRSSRPFPSCASSSHERGDCKPCLWLARVAEIVSPSPHVPGESLRESRKLDGKGEHKA
jgi:hypothetical protein